MRQKNEPKVDRIQLRFFGYDGLKKDIDRLAKIRNESTNQLVLSILHEYMEKIHMNKYITIFLEKNNEKKRSNFDWILILSSIGLVFGFLYTIFIKNNILSNIFAPIFICIMFPVVVYLYYKLFLMAYFSSNKEKIIQKMGIKLYDPISIHPSDDAVLVFKTKYGNVFKWNTKVKGKTNIEVGEGKKIYNITDTHFIITDPI